MASDVTPSSCPPHNEQEHFRIFRIDFSFLRCVYSEWEDMPKEDDMTEKEEAK